MLELRMDTATIIEQIDAEIERLEKAKAIITGETVAARRGRPTGTSKKRTLSPEARAKIAAAQKKRWAKARKG